MWNQAYRKNEADVGLSPLYPTMLEPPQLRWAFIRQIYSIVAIQLFATIAVAATVVTVHPIAHFFFSTGAGLALYIVLIITRFITLCPLYYYHQRHPVNYLLLGVFTVSLMCAFTSAATQEAPSLGYGSIGRRTAPGCSPSHPENCPPPVPGRQRGCNPNEHCRGG